MEKQHKQERRRRPRAHCHRLSVLVGEGRVVAVEIRNISEYGVGLVSGEPLPERATLQLTRPGSAVGCEIECVHCTPAQDEFYTGARFLVDAGTSPVQDYVRHALRAG